MRHLYGGNAGLESTSPWGCRLSRILDILWVVLIFSWANPAGSTAPQNVETVGSVVEFSGQTLQGMCMGGDQNMRCPI
eukprot:1014013-Pyramimonas_sp.AAC.1